MKNDFTKCTAQRVNCLKSLLQDKNMTVKAMNVNE